MLGLLGLLGLQALADRLTGGWSAEKGPDSSGEVQRLKKNQLMD